MIQRQLLAVFHRITDEIASERVDFAKDKDANDLVYDDLFAFCLAACLDRQAQSDRVWLVPHFLKKRWGHLDPARIASMDPDDVAEALKESRCGWRLRMADVANTVISLARLVQEECGGDPTRLFVGSVREILDRLTSIPGVGEGIANMLLIQRIRFFGLRPSGLDDLDVKADTHIVRVFYRLGMSDAETESAAINAARQLEPEDRIAADQACWHISRNFCHLNKPNCPQCPVNAYCEKVGVESE